MLKFHLTYRLFSLQIHLYDFLHSVREEWLWYEEDRWWVTKRYSLCGAVMCDLSVVYARFSNLDVVYVRLKNIMWKRFHKELIWLSIVGLTCFCCGVSGLQIDHAPEK